MPRCSSSSAIKFPEFSSRSSSLRIRFVHSMSRAVGLRLWRFGAFSTFPVRCRFVLRSPRCSLSFSISAASANRLQSGLWDDYYALSQIRSVPLTFDVLLRDTLADSCQRPSLWTMHLPSPCLIVWCSGWRPMSISISNDIHFKAMWVRQRPRITVYFTQCVSLYLAFMRITNPPSIPCSKLSQDRIQAAAVPQFSVSDTAFLSLFLPVLGSCIFRGVACESVNRECRCFVCWSLCGRFASRCIG